MSRYTYVNPNTAYNVTKSDTTVLLPSVIYVGGAGNLKVIPAIGGSAVIFKNLPAGTILPVKVVQVLSTATTCSSIIGMY